MPVFCEIIETTGPATFGPLTTDYYPAQLTAGQRATFGNPKAAILWMSRVADGANVGTDRPGLSIGFTDGTTHVSHSISEREALATTQTMRATLGTVVINQYIEASVLGKHNHCSATFNSWLSGGIRLDWTTAVTLNVVSPKLTIMLLGGDDLVAADCRFFNAATSLDTEHVISIGFEPDVVLTFSGGTTFSGGVFDQAILGIGCAWNSGGGAVNRCIGLKSLDNSGAESARGKFSEAHCCVTLDSSPAQSFEIGNFGSDGYSVWRRLTSHAQYMGCLALKTTNGNFNLQTIRSPVATGVQSYSNGSFEPRSGILSINHIDAIDVDGTGYNGVAGGFGAFSAEKEAYHALSIKHGADPSSLQNQWNAQAINQDNEDFANSMIANIDSYDSDALSFDWTNVFSQTGTAQAGGASTITLAAGASSQANYYISWVVAITGGTGAGQTKTITAYNSGTKVATVDSPWSTNPDNTSTYALAKRGYGWLLQFESDPVPEGGAPCYLPILGVG